MNEEAGSQQTPQTVSDDITPSGTQLGTDPVPGPQPHPAASLTADAAAAEGTPVPTWPTPEFVAVMTTFGAPKQRRFSFSQAAAALGGGLLGTEGRTARSEYWWGSLILAGVWLPVLGLLGWFLSSGSLVVMLAAGLALLAFLPLLLAVEGCRAIRRLQDAGHAGWWILLAAVPFGPVALVWLLTRPGQHGANRYGPMSQPGWDPGTALAS